MAIETLKPTPVAIKLIRGTDCTFVFTILEDGLPKDMSAFAANIPMVRFCDKSLSSGGVVPGSFAQAQYQNGNDPSSKGICEWVAGGVGGQIRMIVPELDGVLNPLYLGTKNATNSPNRGVFDIQVKSVENLNTVGAVGGAFATYVNIQRAVTGTWEIDTEVTNL